ncbi:isoprenylcysteine carboxylmethyltransferase family protein [Vibrio tapetis subsp. quintayensis]|uniref:methyltransferase family protein n=1 Tax=Vibrio tapetis TaxID=52443 RepID=UPI0025B2FA2E|nr:isoprenylcysteine carboxylmethyltransferase family protein [Vibrio tapetis]MDN3679973.1 isoprenylcysteine carboxylmethyltransferase family protein [Vibrio tapetis subsp. quintayensis]
MDRLELKVPPVVVFVLALVLMWWSVVSWPSLAFELPLRTVFVMICVASSGYIGIAGVLEFRRHQTTVNPHTPNNASTVVDTGIFKYTRNPMYLGLVVLLIGALFYWSSLAPLWVIVAFIGYLNRFQISAEERILSEKYGSQYTDYLTKVRRWI